MACEDLFRNWYNLEIEIYREFTKNNQKPPTSLSGRAWQAGFDFNACMNGKPIVTPIFSMEGPWKYGGAPGPSIFVAGNRFTVDMSVYHRQPAQGMISDNSDVLVAFLDDAVYSGKLQRPGTILWSNHSTWTKA